MPTGAAVGAVGLGAAGSIFGIDQQRHASNQANDIARASLDASLTRRFTPYSSVDPRTGAVSIDPSVRGLQAQSLSYIPQYQNQLQNSFGQYSSGLGGVLSGLQGNQNSFLQARQNPLIQQRDQALGATQLSNNLRGIAGSSFANQNLTNIGTDYGRAIADQGALATQESLGAQTGVLSGLYNAGVNNVSNQSALTNQYNAAGIQNLNQELQSLGLSQANIDAMLGAGSLSMKANQNYLTGLGGALYGLGSSFAGLRQTPSMSSVYQQYGWTDPQYNTTYGGDAYGGATQWQP